MDEEQTFTFIETQKKKHVLLLNGYRNNGLKFLVCEDGCDHNKFLVFSPPGSIPGTFFWKPRLGLDLAMPTTESNTPVFLRNKENIRDGTCVLVDGYKAGMAVIAIAAGLSSGPTYPHLNPTSAYFYTNMYRWTLRYISLIPFWIGGNGGNYCDTHKVWKRRYYYMDEFVPSWLQSALFYVKKDEWAKELLEFQRFKKYSESAFGKHYRYPTKVFNKFKSQETIETIENPHEISELSII